MPSPAEEIQRQVAEQQGAPAVPHGGVPGYVQAPPATALGGPNAAALQAKGAGLSAPPPATTPFTEFAFRQHPGVREPSGYEGTGGSMLYIANKFLEGARGGRQEALAKHEDQRTKNVDLVTNALHSVVTDPNLTPVAKQKAQAAYDDYLAKFTLHQIPEGSEKHPLLGAAKGILEGLTGGKIDKKWDGSPGEFLTQLAHIRTDPEHNLGSLISREAGNVVTARNKLLTENPYATEADLEQAAGRSLQILNQAGYPTLELSKGLLPTPKTAEEKATNAEFRARHARQQAAKSTQAELPSTAPPPVSPTTSAPPNAEQFGAETPGTNTEAAVTQPPPTVATPTAATSAPPGTAAAPAVAASVVPLGISKDDLMLLRSLQKGVPKTQTLTNTASGKTMKGEFLAGKAGIEGGWFDDNGKRLGEDWTIGKPGELHNMITQVPIDINGKIFYQKTIINREGKEIAKIGVPEAKKTEIFQGTMNGEPMAFERINGVDVPNLHLTKAQAGRWVLDKQSGEMVSLPAAYTGHSSTLNMQTAQIFLKAADGDKEKARKMAKDAGWQWESQ